MRWNFVGDHTSSNLFISLIATTKVKDSNKAVENSIYESWVFLMKAMKYFLPDHGYCDSNRMAKIFAGRSKVIKMDKAHTHPRHPRPDQHQRQRTLPATREGIEEAHQVVTQMAPPGKANMV